MTVRVLIVDDSGFFRRRIAEILKGDPQLTVIDHASNGLEAIEKVLRLKPDVVTMDVEMPIMDGITAVRKIMAVNPVPILVFSSLTAEGAKATFDALEAGAVDYLMKRFEDISSDHNEAKQILRDKVREIGLHGLKDLVKPGAVTPPSHTATTSKPAIVPKAVKSEFKKPNQNTENGHSGTAAFAVSKDSNLEKKSTSVPLVSGRQFSLNDISAVVIGTSTGGPVALQTLLTQLPQNFPKPILLVQHMPGAFTMAFAQRLDQLSKIHIKEAEDGEVLLPGTAYLAPGGKQMRVQKRGVDTVIRIEDSAPNMTYKPCVDLTFSSVADVYGGRVLAVVLTGMGADGREGAKKLKALGAYIWAQDQESSVVYGMPAAVAQAGIADEILPLNDIGTHMKQGVA